MNQEIPDVQAEFRKGRGTRDQIANICWITEKARSSRKNLLFYWLRWSLWLCGSQQTEKFLKRWEHQIILPTSWEICMQVKKEQLEPDMEQWTGFKLGKKCIKAVYCHPAYLTYMPSESESEVAQSCPTLCDPMDCSRPGSSVHGIFQARILKWVAIPFSRESSQPRDRTWVSHIVGRCFTIWATIMLNARLDEEPGWNQDCQEKYQ